MASPTSAVETAGAAPQPVILVVDDEVLVRLPIADHLRDVGFTVVEAANAGEALEVIASDAPVDLVFTDHNMPGEMDGCALADWLASHRPTLPVILTSGGADVLRTAVARGARFIAKPYAVLEVERQIRRLLGPAPG